ncbi:hypothetical protein PLICBS_004073 [Purpureocillium lilacinum]|uniref:uncharacterized protein n=1 Tax=Purpureocillium lilacinum TaxID=33203 RepID=UPI00208C6443|nr:hypothetical protein PLICBS_004073 [Purpureocillium lilacinum]
MYYGTGDPLKKGQFGLITYNFISPSVNLDHSDWIKVDYDENEGLKVTFTNQDAFNHAKKTWLPKDKGLILIVFIDACEAYKSGERCYFKASNLDVSPDDMTIMVSAEPRHPNDLITSGESQWGWWDPSEGSSLATNPSKAGNEQCQAGNDGPTNDFLKHIHPDTTSISDNGANDRRSIWSWIDDHVVKPIENDAKEILGDMTISDDFNKSLPFKFPESGTGPSAVSPWGGDSMLIWSIGSKSKASVDVYCVGCGVSGDARISGKVKWTPATGFTEGEADLHLDAQFSLKIGVDAHAQFSQSFSKEVFEHTFNMTAFGGFSIIPTIGVNVTADIAAAAQADGKLLAGAEMGLQDAHVIFDLVEPSRNDVGGWWPYFKPVLQADGDVMVSASIGLPIRVSCQVSMGLMSVAATVIDEPSVNATAQAAAWAELNGGKVNWGFNDTDGCTGVRTRLSWRNKLLADVKSAIYSGKILLWDSYDRPLGPSCIP